MRVVSGARCYGVRLTYDDGRVSVWWRATGFPAFNSNVRVASEVAAAQVGKNGVVKAEVVLRHLALTTVKNFTHEGE